MESLEERLKRLRQERIVREKARIDKLKEMNLKKYGKEESFSVFSKSASTTSLANKSVFKTPLLTKDRKARPSSVASSTQPSKTKISLKNEDLRPKSKDNTSNITLRRPETNKFLERKSFNLTSVKKDTNFNVHNNLKTFGKVNESISDINKNAVKMEPKKLRQSLIPTKPNKTHPVSVNKQAYPIRKSLAPTTLKTEQTGRRESVFERLYKPKMVTQKPTNNIQKVQNDTGYRNKLIKNTTLIVNKRQTINLQLDNKNAQPKRSISAIHLKRVSRNELPNCIHKWSSIGEKINKAHLAEINEDASVKTQAVVSAVKSERKKSVKFHMNTPTGEELQSRLKSWLLKRGKSLNSYHHLQCFGLHHLAQTEKEALNFEPYSEENKENIEQSDGDDNSFTDNLGDRKYDFDNKWRRASCVSDSVDLNTTHETTMNSEETPGPGHHVNELLLGALNDLSELLREGFDWEQCARWLRALRERFPHAPNTAMYWECRAVLEESQGNFQGTVECWEQAIAKGTESSVVEASLDQLLDKFMQLNISPSAGKKSLVDSKIVDVKNVFKSTLIRFAVQKAKLRESDNPKYVATPVRRSHRISMISTSDKSTPKSSKKRVPLVQLCSSMKQIDEEYRNNLVFVPNKTLEFTP